MHRLTRITKPFRRVATIDGQPYVVTIGPDGIQLRRFGRRRDTAVPVTWRELAREGGLLDAAELAERPLLAALVTSPACGRGRTR